MKRFRRWVVNGIVALSLVLCLATCVLWVRSYFVVDVFNWTDTYSRTGRLGGGGPDGSSFESGAGFPREFRIYGNPIPYALVALLTAVLPLEWLLEWLRALRRRRLIAKGICASYGYDLRASPDRCPECGAIPQKKEIISN